MTSLSAIPLQVVEPGGDIHCCLRTRGVEGECEVLGSVPTAPISSPYHFTPLSVTASRWLTSALSICSFSSCLEQPQQMMVDSLLSWGRKKNDSIRIHLRNNFTQCAPVGSTLKVPSVTRVWQWLGTSYTNSRCRCHSHSHQHSFVAQKVGQSVLMHFPLPLTPPGGNEEKYSWLARLHHKLSSTGHLDNQKRTFIPFKVIAAWLASHHRKFRRDCQKEYPACLYRFYRPT